VGRIEDFGETQDVEITILVDNRADLLVESSDTVKRYTERALLAEHGFSALVDLKDAGVRILWDAGMTKIALVENARRLEIDLSTVDKIALSHGHRDHYEAMTGVIQAVVERASAPEWGTDVTARDVEAWLLRRRVPLVAHPAAFRERWWIDKKGKKHGPHLVPCLEWEAAGAEIILSAGPHMLGPGCWVTGAVPRETFEQAGIGSDRRYREGDRFLPDHLEDDQSIVINVKDKGLAVLTGCAHSGVVNTVNYAQKISGVDRVWAILGGFHLAPAKDQDIERTIDEIEAKQPAMVVPSHCTGFRGIQRFANRMPDQFVLGAVGTRYLF
jgi:7,8-dihydropterin-6-yl-methyl-4-(beta-D-ribofuranosyl)aminobenzene 5'-phosphate synthase